MEKSNALPKKSLWNIDNFSGGETWGKETTWDIQAQKGG